MDSTKGKTKTRRMSLQLLQDTIASLGWRYWAFFASTILFGLAALLPPQLFRYFTENAVTQNTPEGFMSTIGVFGGLIAFGLFVSSFGNTLCQEWLRLRLEASLRRKVLLSLHRMSLVELDSAQRGDWLTRMTGDLKQAENFMTESIPKQIRSSAILVGAGSLFVVHSGIVGLIPLVTAIFIASINVFVQRSLAPVLRELREMHGSVFQSFIESLEGIRTIRSHSAERFVQKRFEKKLGFITNRGMRAVKVLGALLGSNEFLSQLMVTVCLTAAAWGLSQGALTITEILVYPFYLTLFFGAAQGLAGSAYDWNRYFAEAGRLAQLISPSGKNEADKWQPILDETKAMGAKSLSLTGIEIGYQHKVIAGPFDIHAKFGEMVAITGPSGCGKSTLLEVLAGLRPTMGGQGVIKDANGQALWQQPSSCFKLPQGMSAYVEQRPYIFEGTLRENLSFGNKDLASDSELWNALERAHIAEYMKSVGGLDFHIRDQGQNLSEGQRYRLAIARALLLKREFLLLDEPFAALDEESVENIVATLEAEMKHAAVVLITHYLPPQLKVDNIIRFESRNELTQVNSLDEQTLIKVPEAYIHRVASGKGHSRDVGL